MKTFVTFGHAHFHEINGKCFDQHCVAVIHASSPAAGRKKAFDLFGPKFAFEYFDNEFDTEKMKYFPRGLIEVEEVSE